MRTEIQSSFDDRTTCFLRSVLVAADAEIVAGTAAAVAVAVASEVAVQVRM